MLPFPQIGRPIILHQTPAYSFVTLTRPPSTVVACERVMRTPPLGTRQCQFFPNLLHLLALPCALAFVRPHQGLGTCSPGRAGSSPYYDATWSRSSRCAAFSVAVARDSAVNAVATGRRERHTRQSSVTSLRGKKRKKVKKFASDETNWFDEGGDDDAVDMVGAGAATPTTAPSTTTPIDMATNSAAALQKGASRLAVGGRKRGDDRALDSITDDDLLVKDRAGSLDGDGGNIVLETGGWVKGDTGRERLPIVGDAVGPPDVLAAEDIDMGTMDDLERETIVTTTATTVASIDGSNGGLPRVVEQESGRNGMDVPDDDTMLGEGLKMGRGLDDMLMERSIRFYDPKVTGEREKCYLVGLEASGWGMRNKKGTKGAFPEARPASEAGDEEGDDGWNDEQEAAFQEEKMLAYEARKEEREMRFSLEESMAELSELAGTAGLEVAGSTYQRVLEPNPRTYIGTGKVKEIKAAMNALGVCTVIFDDELSPGQQRSLEVEFGGEAAGIKVLDRTALILDIFAQHARTKEGQLQVELALHMYRLPRLTKLWTHLERQQGGVGLRGPGERQLEVDRRLLKDKIIALKKELTGVRKHRDFQRRSRKKLGLPVIALVGYTNAGKSTLLNTLTRAGVMAENMLFATLDPTTRKVKLTGLKVHPEVMLTDTVGFIQKLPTNLVAAFRATLEEVVEADVIVHIVDVSSSSREKQESAVVGVLDEMGAVDKPMLTLWNKLDLLPDEEQDEVRVKAEERDELTAAASAKTGEGLDEFVACLEEAICALLFKVEAVVPYSRGDLMSRVHELGACDTEEYTDAGTLIQARVPRELANRLEPYFTDDFRETIAGEERDEAGEEAAVARAEEDDWKLIAKKRIKAGVR